MNHNDAIRLFAKTLQNMEQWMDKAAAYAKAKSFEVDVLVHARLAPDQFAFVQQVQAGCDQAKYAAAYLSGKQAPSHPDTEKTFAELRQRIQKCLSFLETVQAKDLAGSTGTVRKIIECCIEHDALIAGGSSGGPLLDANSNVVGINTALVKARGDRKNETDRTWALKMSYILESLRQAGEGQGE